MKNICVQKSNNKFVNNIIDCDTDRYKFTVLDIQQYIYKKHFSYKFDSYLFSTSSINNEILQFINDFHNDIAFVIYHNSEHTINFPSSCRHIVDTGYANINNCVVLPKNIINRSLYSNLQKIPKNNDIIFFLDYESIPIEIESKLYPNSKKPIKLFNNPSISNYHNMGLLSETDRRDILLESKYYACQNDHYKIEALLCGCEVLDINTLDESCPIELGKDTEQYTDYQTFLSEIFI